MEEKLYVLGEEKLNQILNMLVEAPYRFVKYPISILENLDRLEIKDGVKESDVEVIEG